MTTMNESAGNLGQKYRTLFEIIRELESLIERAVILSPDPDLRVPLSELKGPWTLRRAPTAQKLLKKPSGNIY